MAYEVTEETFQVYLSSDGCLDTFPDNSPNNFKIVLKRRKEFRGKNQKYTVGLSRFGYDAAMYNLGENTGVYMTLLIGGAYYTVMPKNQFVTDCAAAVQAFTEVIASMNVAQDVARPLSAHISFEAKPNNTVVLTLSNVEDFGVSPMMRKLFGFHKSKKFRSELFDFRKVCRDLLFEVSESGPLFGANLAAIAEVFEPDVFLASRVNVRNDVMAEYGMGVKAFYKNFKEDLETSLQEIVKGRRSEYESFVAKSYRVGELTFIDCEFELQGKQLSVPASVWTIIDFILAIVVRTSYIVQGSRTITPDVDFNPNLFHCLYVYTNLIKPVDFNDGEFRLLDIVLLKRTKGVQSEVIEHQSTQYKILEVDTLSEIQIVITTSLGLPAPFIYGPVFVVLEFRRT
jgi:hypothetical protein